MIFKILFSFFLSIHEINAILPSITELDFKFSIIHDKNPKKLILCCFGSFEIHQFEFRFFT